MRFKVAVSTLALAVAALGYQAEIPSSDVVAVQSGNLEGEQHDGIRVFKGIPYAAAPVGELRWRAPSPPAKWIGIRKATEFGPA